jgi:pimeloyl-ACP methyl ester carboxylesterase
MPTVVREGAQLHYEVHGDGPPLVFAHGSGGNTLIWWQQVPHFARSRRVIVFDHRGWGRSRCTEGGLHPRHFAADLLAILDDAGAEQADLVCQSMGGWTGLPFLEAHPGRVRRLVLCGTSGGFDTPLVAADRARVNALWQTTPMLDMVLSRAFRDREPARAHLYAQIAALTPRESVATVRPLLASVRIAPEKLAGNQAPILVLSGDEDWFFKPETLADMASRIPNARATCLAGVGHSSYFEVPEEFNRIVDEFLTS